MSSEEQQQSLPDKTLQFRTIPDCRNYAIAYSVKHNFAVATQDSNYSKGYVNMECTHHRQYRKAKGKPKLETDVDDEDDDSDTNDAIDTETGIESTSDITKTKQKRNGKTSRSGCPVFIYFNRTADNIYRITSFFLKHDHEPASTLRNYHLHRRINDDQQADVKLLVGAKSTPRAIVKYMNDKHECLMKARDVNNWRYRFGLLDNNECNNMAQFIAYLETKNYEVRWCTNTDKEITALFFSHEKCMEQARKFNEVVLVDATFKTNRTKNYFLNMVGVNNVGCDDKTLSTFGIAGAWVSREDEATSIWVMEQLANTVYYGNERLPAIFVTDRQQAVINAISFVFPNAKQMLCYIHLAKNFQANTGKTFLTVESYKKAEGLFKSFGRCVNEGGYDSANSSLVAFAEKHTSDKGESVKKYLER